MSKKDTDKKNLTPLSKEEILDTSINDTKMDGIHENDESFFEFVDAKMVENDLKDMESDVAPDEFREELFGKDKHKKSSASNSILDSLGWLLMPKPAFALIGAVLLLVFLIPTMGERSVSDSTVAVDTDKRLQEDIPTNSNKAEDMAPMTELEESILLADIDGDENESVDENTVIYRSGIISNEGGVLVRIDENILSVIQNDDLERDIIIYKDEKLFIQKSLDDFKIRDNDSGRYLEIKLEKGIYKLEVSFLGRGMLLKQINIK
tara:strand:- start:520 stop:1311 length:792 start_codon:yes stop_codon:yes gene_type:complete